MHTYIRTESAIFLGEASRVQDWFFFKFGVRLSEPYFFVSSSAVFYFCFEEVG